MRVPDAADHVSLGRRFAGVDGARDLVKVAADRPHAIGKKTENGTITFPEERPHAGAFHG
jgi:hypothetical protein